MYYIGIDGSGTFSRLIAADGDMKVIGRHAGNSVSIRLAGFGNAKVHLRKLVLEFNKLTDTKPEDCAAICVATAGLAPHPADEKLRDILAELDFTCPVATVNEAGALLAAETDAGDGVLVMAGSGAYSYAVDAVGNVHISGGYGWLDDAGSAYWIGMRAVKAALMAADGRGPKTVLTDKIKEQMGLDDIFELVERSRSEAFNRNQISELTLAVKYAVKQNDPAARQIEADAARELYCHASAGITRSLLHSGRVITAGSVFATNAGLRKQFESMTAREYTSVRITSLTKKSELGALYLAARQAR